jgi:hypothetical protein
MSVNTLSEHNEELLHIKGGVYIVTTGLQKDKMIALLIDSTKEE